MAAATHPLTAQAAMTVRVSRSAPGDLTAGTRAQIERVDGVRVDEIEIDGIRPGLNDTTVEATAMLRVDRSVDSERDADVDSDDAESRVVDRLAGGFGVEPERVDLVDPPG